MTKYNNFSGGRNACRERISVWYWQRRLLWRPERRPPTSDCCRAGTRPTLRSACWPSPSQRASKRRPKATSNSSSAGPRRFRRSSSFSPSRPACSRCCSRTRSITTARPGSRSAWMRCAAISKRAGSPAWSKRWTSTIRSLASRLSPSRSRQPRAITSCCARRSVPRAICKAARSAARRAITP